MSKKQSYQNRGMRNMLMNVIAWTLALGANLFNRKTKVDFLNESYKSGGGSGGDTKREQHTPQYQHKATIEKKRRRKEIQHSQRINRKRKARVCSFK
jgi:hypothetical protein